MRCTAKDGHDVVGLAPFCLETSWQMDTRDHNEYEKIVRKMRETASANGELKANASPAEIQALFQKRL